MEILQHAHSGLRWVVLILLLAAIQQAFAGMRSNKPFSRTPALLALISVHTQLLLGLALYIWGKWYQPLPPGITDENMKAVHRFFGMEHITAMLLAIILITVGNARAKRAATDKAKHKAIFIFFLIGLVIILASIPWPFMQRFHTMGWF